MPTEGISSDAELARMIKKNPFMTKEAIHDFFMKRRRGYLDDQFEEYCTEELMFILQVHSIGGLESTF